MSSFNKAKEITDKTKQIVMDRQNSRSITGVFLTKETASFHHYIERSSSGVGYEWNIVALTFDEHRAIHDRQPIKVNGKARYTCDELNTLIRNHFILNYIGWSEDKCKYKKYKTEDEYGVKRRTQSIK